MSRSLSARPLLFLALGAAIVVPTLAGCGSAPAEPVASYEAFEATDKSFTGEGPAGWEKSAGDLGGTVGKVDFAKGGATIRITSDAASSFMGDAAKGGQIAPVEAVHNARISKLEEWFSDPQPDAPKPMPSKVGDARYCEFTADGGKTHGYRCTMLGPQRAIFVTTSCPESDWEVLKPAFSHVIGSIQAGTGP